MNDSKVIINISLFKAGGNILMKPNDSDCVWRCENNFVMIISWFKYVLISTMVFHLV